MVVLSNYLPRLKNSKTWVMLTNYVYTREIKSYDFKTASGEEFTLGFMDFKKTKDGYVLAGYVCKHGIRSLPSLKFHIINASIDSCGRVHNRRSAQATETETQQFKRAEIFNMKSKLVKAGVLEIVNGRMMYFPNRDNPTVERELVPNFADSIAEPGFNGSHVSEIRIMSKLKVIPSNCFRCPNLEKLELPDSVKTIESRAICETKLVELEIPKSVSTIGNYGIIHNNLLKEVRFKGPLKYLGNYALSHNSSLERVRLPSGLSVIRTATFYKDFSLKDLYIPKSVTMIERSAFSGIITSGRRQKLVIHVPKHLLDNAIMVLLNEMPGWKMRDYVVIDCYDGGGIVDFDVYWRH